MNNNFVVLNNNDLETVNGGLIGTIITAVVLVGGSLVGDHVLEEKTGKDAVEWFGTGLSVAGQKLQDLGNKLMN